MKPTTYDMTFCVSNCKNKCYRHISKNEFEVGRLFSVADFNCKKNKPKKIGKNIPLKKQ